MPAPPRSARAGTEGNNRPAGTLGATRALPAYVHPRKRGVPNLSERP